MYVDVNRVMFMSMPIYIDLFTYIYIIYNNNNTNIPNKYDVAA